MLFKSNGKFIDDVTDSFNRFGIQTKLAEKGISKNTQRFEMYDSIHDSGYVSVAVDKPVGKNAEKEWENIIENDLLPVLTNSNNSNTNPASALIVPSKDIDMVEKMLINKGLSPSVYQLFPGYVVAGINKKDTAKLVNEYSNRLENNKKKNEEKPPENNIVSSTATKEKQEDNPQKNIKENKTEDIEKKKLDTLNALSSIENKPAKQVDKKNNTKQQQPKSENMEQTKKPSSSMKKLATAALLGTAIGVGAAAYPEISSKLNDVITPDKENIEQSVLNDAAKKYFEGLKNGYEKDDELLEIISKNPNLAEKYINELANTPVQTSALKNKSLNPDILREKALSDDETVRAAVAENPNTPPDILEHLARDKSTSVLKSLVKNPSISKDMMDNLSNFSGLHNDMMENPAITPEIMRKITAGKNRDCEFNKKYMSNPCISVDELLYNINNPDECIRQGIASNPNADKNMIEKLAKDKSPAVRNTAYKHKNMPVEEINKLFPENWVVEPNDLVKESARNAALENPNISPDIRKKAIFIDPQRYGKAVAANQNISPELINKMKNIAQGKKGVEHLIQKANNIKNNPEQLKQIKTEMDANNESIEKPVRRILNKQFVEHVYDPYQLINNMRRIPSSKKKFNLNKYNKSQNNLAENGNGYKNLMPEVSSSSILDKNGNPPEFFAKEPLPPLTPGNISYNPDAEKEALRTADNIINNIMADVLPDIKQSLKTSSYIPNNVNSVDNNKALQQIPDGKNKSINSYINNGAGNNDKKLYENACREIDELHRMF